VSAATDLLDLVPGVGHVEEGIRFELRSNVGGYMGEVNPQRVVAIENRSDSAIKRTISDFVLTPADNAAINPLTDRIWPYWRLSTGDEWQLGVLLFGAVANHRFSYGVNAYSRLVDQGVILQQETDRDVGFPSGTRFVDALAAVFDMAGVHTYSVPFGASATVLSPIAYPASTFTTWASIASDLCAKAGLLDWYFSNTGVLTVIEPPSLAAPALLKYNDGPAGRILAASAVESTDILDAPNRYKVIDSSARDYAVIGIYDLPNDAPNSIANRRYAITKTVQAPGVGTNDAAAAFAQALAQVDVKAYETVTWSSPPDPRHDTWSTVEYRTITMQELSWRLTCAPGGPMEHQARRVYYQ
jgi:hypothetical protein